MAATATQGKRTVPGADTLVPADVACDNSYVANGYPLGPATFGLTVLRRIISVRPRNIASAIYTPVLVETINPDGSIASFKLALVVATTGLQVAAAVDVSAASFHLVGEGN
jgi:hypothetical protein